MDGGSPTEGLVELDRPAFLISIDVEMSWGLQHRPEREYRYDQERADLTRLLDLFDRHQTPATWAVVGHLFLESCQPVDGVVHPEIVRPQFDWLDRDWFADDPGRGFLTDPSWYAPDLVDLIRGREVGHEIGCHGFSHIMAGEPGCSRETFASELAAATAAARRHQLDLASFIHPRNSIGHVDQLAAHGYRAFRGPRRPPATTAPRFGRLLGKLRLGPDSVVLPYQQDGVWSFPSTTMFDVEHRQRSWPLWIRQVERRLDQAIREQSLFHLWFHPHNIRDGGDAFYAALDRICGRAARHRETGRLRTTTMGDLAALLDQSSPAGASERALD